MSDGHFALALARLASTAREIGTRPAYDLASAVAAVGLAYDNDQEELLIELLGVCADGYLVYEGPAPATPDPEIALAMAIAQVRAIGRVLQDEDSLCGLASIAVCAVSIEYFRNNVDRLDRLATAMAYCVLPVTVKSKGEAHAN